MVNSFSQWRIIFDEFQLLARLLKSQSTKYLQTFGHWIMDFFLKHKLYTIRSHEWFIFVCSSLIYTWSRESMMMTILFSIATDAAAALFMQMTFGKIIISLFSLHFVRFGACLRLPEQRSFFGIVTKLRHTLSLSLSLLSLSVCVSHLIFKTRAKNQHHFSIWKFPSYVSVKPWQSDFSQYVSAYGNWLIDTWKIT